MNDLHEHLSPAQVAAYAGRQLPSAERLTVSDHLTMCAGCRALVAEALPPAPPPASVFTDLLAAAREADGPLDDGWQSDAALPARTPEELMELREFEAQMAAFEPERFAPGETLRKEPAAAGRRQPAPAADGGFWRWLTVPWVVGFAAAIVVAAVLLARMTLGPAGRSGSGAAVVDGPLVVRADGGLDGMLSLPADLRDAVLETVRRRSAPGALLGTVTRGDSNAPEAGKTPVVAPAAEFTPESPVGVIESDRPVFRWKPGAGGANVQVIVQGSVNGERIRSGVLLPMSWQWTSPAPLARGQIYHWQVGPVKSVDDSPKTTFKVLSAEAHARLEALRAGEGGRSHLALGVAYAREGMHAEAREEFRRLESENVGSPLARQILDSAETWQ